MLTTTRSKAEERFAKVRHQETQALKEREKADKAINDKTARLRALRLAKEAADKEAAEAAAAEVKKTPRKRAKTVKKPAKAAAAE
jgi:hypothetical protein